jgi:hypothetical protein
MARIIISEASIELLPLCLHLQPLNSRPSHRQLHGLQLARTILSLSSHCPKDDAHEGGPSTHSYSHPGIGAAFNIVSRNTPSLSSLTFPRRNSLHNGLQTTRPAIHPQRSVWVPLWLVKNSKLPGSRRAGTWIAHVRSFPKRPNPKTISRIAKKGR